MKFSYVFLLAFLLALLINLTASAGTLAQPLRSFRFWLATVLTTGALTGYALWISYIRIHFSPHSNGKFTRFKKWNASPLYFLFALTPIYVVHLTMIAIIGEALDIVQDIVLHYLLYYMPTIVVVTVFYAFTLLHRHKLGLLYHVPLLKGENSSTSEHRVENFASKQQRMNMQAERVADLLPRPLEQRPVDTYPDQGPATVEQGLHKLVDLEEMQESQVLPFDKTDRSRFDNESYPQNLYYYLIEKGGAKLSMLGAAPRFLDIVFINSASRWRYVILRNGEKLQADAVLGQLKKRELDKWMLKISANIYVNMLLVIYPLNKKANQLELQPDIVAALLEKYSLVDQRKLLKIGRGMPKDILEKFLVNVRTMDHKGWNDFIPLT
ncbi:hypothetical protein [Sphingobacterium deserti]|nr:hypothetical protein [Sphingobacterium deserti]